MTKNAGDTVTAPGEAAIQVFTANGTWNKPNGVRAVRVRVVGGGGGSGGCAGAGTGGSNSAGGSGGGYVEAYILAANLSSSETVTVGALGAGGAVGNNPGANGGTSSFGVHCSATGGGGGAGMASTTGSQIVTSGTPGTGAGGDLNLSGSYGGLGATVSGVASKDGYGGASGGGLGGSIRQSNTVTFANPGLSYGGGGAGVFAANTSPSGSNGAAGVVIVESIF